MIHERYLVYFGILSNGLRVKSHTVQCDFVIVSRLDTTRRQWHRAASQLAEFVAVLRDGPSKTLDADATPDVDDAAINAVRPGCDVLRRCPNGEKVAHENPIQSYLK